MGLLHVSIRPGEFLEMALDFRGTGPNLGSTEYVHSDLLLQFVCLRLVLNRLINVPKAANGGGD